METNSTLPQHLTVAADPWTQGVYVALSLLGMLLMPALLFGWLNPQRFRVRMLMSRYARTHGRGVILMTHTQTGFLNNSHIDAFQVNQVMRRIRSAKGKPVDLILHTPGGQLIPCLSLARALRTHPNVRVVIPKYAYSGGTLIALGAVELQCSPLAALGPVDPQVGNLFSQFGAKEWAEVARLKGNKGVKDDTVAFSVLGERLMREMDGYLGELLEGRKADRKALASLLLHGDNTHARLIKPSDLNECGFPTTTPSDTLAEEIVEACTRDGVHAYIP